MNIHHDEGAPESTEEAQRTRDIQMADENLQIQPIFGADEEEFDPCMRNKKRNTYKRTCRRAAQCEALVALRTVKKYLQNIGLTYGAYQKIHTRQGIDDD